VTIRISLSSFALYLQFCALLQQGNNTLGCSFDCNMSSLRDSPCVQLMVAVSSFLSVVSAVVAIPEGIALVPEPLPKEGRYKNCNVEGDDSMRKQPPIECTYPDNTTYRGAFWMGAEHGEGTWIDGNRDLTYTGTFKFGAKQGKGVFEWPDRQTYNGEWFLDKQSGRGEWSGGEGKLKGHGYSGSWFKGQILGLGLYTWGKGDLDGGRYKGQMHSNAVHGQGKMEWPSGEVYNGRWEWGKRHGGGVYRRPEPVNGTAGAVNSEQGRRWEVYQGEWRQDVAHGRGKLVLFDGSVYDGIFEGGTYIRPGAHIHTYTHIHMHTCTHTHIHTCIPTHAHMHTRTHAHTHTHHIQLYSACICLLLIAVGPFVDLCGATCTRLQPRASCTLTASPMSR
jgi:hypothetical protein